MLLALLSSLFFASGISASAQADIGRDYPSKNAYDENPNDLIFGQSGIKINTRQAAVSPSQTRRIGVGVNAWLWRAALDTISFMPLLAADPFGGVIISDWFIDSATPDERLKLTIYIIGTELRADALRVAVHRQMRDATGWHAAPIAATAQRQLEEKILFRARTLLQTTQ